MLDDIQKVLFHEQTILSRLDALAARITEDYRGQDLSIIAVLNGSLIFAADLLRRLPLPVKLDCLSASSYRGAAQSSGSVSFRELPMSSVNGRHILILDDILDTGLTLRSICEKLRVEASPLSVRICVLLRKDKPRAADLEADYVGFDIGDEFVVGYGLDYQERYRNLPFIGVLNSAVFSK